jgi:cytochrome c-type biogenesis protein CcmH/NrfG
MAAGHGTTVAEPDAGERLDRQALMAYRSRLREIDEELDEAQSWNDTARAERIEAEREALLRELAGATGLGGRVRTIGGAAERARVAVRKAAAAALDRIDAEDQATARLLRRTVHTGSACRYEPDPDTPVDWLL